MKRPYFAPEGLLKLRRRALDEMEAALALAEGRRAAAFGKSRELEERGLEIRAAVGVAGSLRGADLRQAAAASEALLAQARDALLLAKALEREASAALRKVVAARREVETLEALRDRAMAEWRRAADREQEALAAELFLARLARRGPEG